MNPYLSFAGNCEEAMAFYKGIFGGELSINHFAGSPMESDVPADFKSKVMHAHLAAPAGVLMGSDNWHGVPEGSRVSLSITTSAGDARTYFDALAKGGSVTMPFGEVFWGGSFGMVTDKFGFTWMISAN